METALHCEKCMRSVVLLCRKITKNIYSWTNLSLLAPSEIIFILTHFYFQQLLCSFLIKSITALSEDHTAALILHYVCSAGTNPHRQDTIWVWLIHSILKEFPYANIIYICYFHIFVQFFLLSLIPLSIDSLNATVVFYTWWLLHLDVICGASVNRWSFAFN